MNLETGSDEDTHILSGNEFTTPFQEYNTVKLENLLRSFPPVTQKHIKALPLFFHLNQNLFPGFINHNIPHTIFNYIPDDETVKHGTTFNSAFDYTPPETVEPHSIDAIYLQDHIKSGRLILWVVHSAELDAKAISLLKLKANAINKWREARHIKLVCHVARPHDMPGLYWNNQFDSIRPDKSIFLDEFYGECILLAGKAPAWWFIPADMESSHDQILDGLEENYPDIFNALINFGSIANTRPQDYLAYALLNIANIRQCPHESWLNILELCHKLTVYPQLDTESGRLKLSLYSGADNQISHMRIYSDIINETIASIYGRESSILVDRALRILSKYQSFTHKYHDIYKQILAGRNSNLANSSGNNLDYELTIATEIIYDLTRCAFIWLLDKIKLIDPSLVTPESDMDIAIHSLVDSLEFKTHHIPVTNINTIDPASSWDVRIRNNAGPGPHWSLSVIAHNTNEHEIKKAGNPFELTIWAVLNRVIHPGTRISVTCPYRSVKQTQLADVTDILLRNLSLTTDFGWSLADHLSAATIIKEILIFNQIIQAREDSGPSILIYRVQFTSHGQCMFAQHKDMRGLLEILCDAISSDLEQGTRPHEIEMHCISSGAGNALILDAKSIHKELINFAYKARKDTTHLIDQINSMHYGVTRTNNRLTPHPDLNSSTPEDKLPAHDYMRIAFSDNVNNHKLLNYIYNNNTHGLFQLFYQVMDNTAQVYILDENGCLIRFTQPYHDMRSFIHQWIMFMYNIRNKIRSITNDDSVLPNMDIFEIKYSEHGYLTKTRINSSSLPADDKYFDVQMSIQGDTGKQVIVFKCEGKAFSSADYGVEIYTALRQYLAKNFKSGQAYPIYVSDVDIPLSQLHTSDANVPHIRDYIRYKMNIEKRLNAMINKT